MIILVAVAAAVVGAPIVAAVIVSYASLREESAYSLCRRPPGRLAAFARKLLSFQSYGVANMIEPRVPRPRRPADAGTSGASGVAPLAGTADADTQPGRPFARQ